MGPKILFLDIETAPILAYVWGLWGNDVGLNQIAKDWHIMSFAAKWLGSKEMIYFDQRKKKNVEDDKELLEKVWPLLDAADIIVTQNGKEFDSKKLNSRFLIAGMQPPSPYKHIDTLILAKRHFAFTSNKLEYMTDKLCTKYKKLKHKKFPGINLWTECIKGNPEAWKEMEKYNKHDVLALEELYEKIIPWDASIDFNAYREDTEIICSCGNKEFIRKGFAISNTGKRQRFRCTKCGKWTQGRRNFMSTEKRALARLKAQ